MGKNTEFDIEELVDVEVLRNLFPYNSFQPTD